MKRLLLVGGGHSHVEVLRQFGLAPVAGVEIVLVSPDRFTPYSGMLPGWVAGHYSVADCHIDLDHVSRFARARFIQSQVVAVDRGRREAVLANGKVVGFDVAAIDIGSTPPLDGIDGAREFAVPVKPVADFIAAVEQLGRAVQAGALRTIAVIGGGAAGVEVLLAARHRLLAARTGIAIGCALLTGTPTILPGHTPRVRALMAADLARQGVEVHTGFEAVAVDDHGVIARDGRQVQAGFVVVATGAAAASWPAASGFAVDARGFIRVDGCLQSINTQGVFATGDIASLPGNGVAKSGVYAVRQGPVLAAGLRAALHGRALVPYDPQPAALALISAGRKHAIASRNGLAVAGDWVWRWKDHIDRKFMRKYSTLPAPAGTPDA